MHDWHLAQQCCLVLHLAVESLAGVLQAAAGWLLLWRHAVVSQLGGQMVQQSWPLLHRAEAFLSGWHLAQQCWLMHRAVVSRRGFLQAAAGWPLLQRHRLPCMHLSSAWEA